jgi:hypothetical protein
VEYWRRYVENHSRRHQRTVEQGTSQSEKRFTRGQSSSRERHERSGVSLSPPRVVQRRQGGLVPVDGGRHAVGRSGVQNIVVPEGQGEAVGLGRELGVLRSSHRGRTCHVSTKEALRNSLRQLSTCAFLGDGKSYGIALPSLFDVERNVAPYAPMSASPFWYRKVCRNLAASRFSPSKLDAEVLALDDLCQLSTTNIVKWPGLPGSAN